MNALVMIPHSNGPLEPTELDSRHATSPDLVKAVSTAVADVPAGFPQYLRTRQNPAPLLASLASRGIRGEPAEMPDGSWRTLLRRPTPGQL